MKYLLPLLILGACASGQGVLSDKAKEIEVVANKPTDCHVVGKVVGKDNNGSTEMALNHALNQAAKLGATALYVDQEVPNGKARSVHATGYHCN